MQIDNAIAALGNKAATGSLSSQLTIQLPAGSTNKLTCWSNLQTNWVELDIFAELNQSHLCLLPLKSLFLGCICVSYSCRSCIDPILKI